MTPDTTARDALAAALRSMGLFKSRSFAEGAADAILADLTTDGFTIHPVTCPLDRIERLEAVAEAAEHVEADADDDPWLRRSRSDALRAALARLETT